MFDNVIRCLYAVNCMPSGSGAFPSKLLIVIYYNRNKVKRAVVECIRRIKLIEQYETTSFRMYRTFCWSALFKLLSHTLNSSSVFSCAQLLWPRSSDLLVQVINCTLSNDAFILTIWWIHIFLFVIVIVYCNKTESEDLKL